MISIMSLQHRAQQKEKDDDYKVNRAVKRRAGNLRRPRPKRQRVNDVCLGDDRVEKENANPFVVRPNLRKNRFKSRGDEANHNVKIHRINSAAVAMKQEDQRDEWRDCLEWLDQVGLGQHCDRLAAQWEKDEMDFHTLKRLKDDHLV